MAAQVARGKGGRRRLRSLRRRHLALFLAELVGSRDAFGVLFLELRAPRLVPQRGLLGSAQTRRICG